MIPEKAFAGWLQPDEPWEGVAEFETQSAERFPLVVREMANLRPILRCPEPTGDSSGVACHGHAEPRT